MLEFERGYWNRGITRLAGVDEAGRGPLAGPVVAAAVVLVPEFAEREWQGALEGLTDSKRLSAMRRRTFCDLLFRSPDVQATVAFISVESIDALNIRNASHLAMRRAVAKLSPPPEAVLIDGLPVADMPYPSEAVVRGDGRSLSIAAASIVAKVLRDAHMLELDRLYPQYGFARHKGYGTSEHIQALLEYGPCPAHRRSFRPVRETAAIHAGSRE